MKNWILIVVFVLIVPVTLVYAEINSEKSISSLQAASNQKSKETLKQNKQKPEKKLKERQKSNWPATFIPSEKIKADSSVPFPVDI